MTKGVSPVIASVIIVLVAVSLAGAFLVFTQSASTQLTEGAQESQERLQAELDTRFSIESVSDSRVFLRNLGDGNITADDISIFLDNRIVSHSIQSPIPGGEVGAVDINYDRALGLGEKVLRIEGGGLSDGTRVEVQPVDGLEAHYMFDEGSGTTAFDSTSNGNNGTVNGAQWTDGRFGSGLRFDGVDDFVDVGDADELDIKDELTMVAWVNYSNDDRNEIVSKANEYLMAIESQKLYIRTWGDNNGGSTDPVPMDAWVQVAITWNNDDTAGVYINRTLDETASVNDFNTPTNKPFVVGKRSDSNTNWFNGTIDEVRLYSRIVDEDELGHGPDELYTIDGV